MKLFGIAGLAAAWLAGSAVVASAGWGCGCPTYYYSHGRYYYVPPAYAAPVAPAAPAPAVTPPGQPSAGTPAAPPATAQGQPRGQTFRNFSYEPGDTPEAEPQATPAIPTPQRPARTTSATPRYRSSGSHRPSYLRGGSKMMGRFGQ